MIARPHGSLSRVRSDKTAIHKKEAEVTEKLVRNRYYYSCSYRQRNTLGKNIHTHSQWKEQQEFGDIAFIPERVRVTVIYFTRRQ